MSLAIWDALKSVDPKYTKTIEHGQGGTSINTTYITRRLTEQFGPIGHGWWYSVTHSTQEIPNLKDGTISHILCHCDLELITVLDAALGHAVCVRGTWKQVFLTRSGDQFLDEDAPMKAETRALSKAASRLGVGADIYLGEWDRNGPPAAAPEVSSTSVAIKERFEARCAMLRVHPNAHGKVLDTLLTELGIEKTDEALKAGLDRLYSAIDRWDPLGAATGADSRPSVGSGENEESASVQVAREILEAPATDDAKILRYMHGAIKEQVDGVDADDLHELLKLALPARHNGKLAAIDNMTDATKVVEQASRIRRMTSALIIQLGEDIVPGHSQAFLSLKNALPKDFNQDMSEVDNDKLAESLIKRTVNLMTTGNPKGDTSA